MRIFQLNREGIAIEFPLDMIIKTWKSVEMFRSISADMNLEVVILDETGTDENTPGWLHWGIN